MSELVGQVRAALAERRVDPAARPDLFCTPFRPESGPLSDCIIKSYRGGRDPEVLELVARRHQTYIDCLDRAGLAVPQTRFLILNEHGFLRPVVVQSALPEATLLSHQVATRPLADALRALDQTAVAVTEFWRGVAQRPERIGLHAIPRNFAVTRGGVFYLETCPPLIGYSREEMGTLMLRFTESGLMRGLGSVLPGRTREVQDAWYAQASSLAVLIEGAIRTRGKDRGAIVDWARAFAAARLNDADRASLRARIERKRPTLSQTTAKMRLWSGNGARPNA